MESTIADFEVDGFTRTRTGGVLPGVAPANAYPSADGSDVLIGANADTVFARLCAAMGQPDLAADPRFREHGARGENMAELDALIGAWTATQHSRDLLGLLAAHAVPASRVYTAPDMVDDPHYAARQMIIRATSRAGYEVPMPGVVPKFSRTPGSVEDVGPALGEHTRRVLAELAGVDDREWEALRGSGVVA